MESNAETKGLLLMDSEGKKKGKIGEEGWKEGECVERKEGRREERKEGRP